MKEELICELLQEPDPHKLMGPDVTHARVLRELADVIPRMLSIILEKLWRSEDVQKTGKMLMSPHLQKGLKQDPGNYRPVSFIPFPGKAGEQILLRAITSQIKHMIGKSQQGFTKGKSCLRNLITF